jgi:hypothetical protein
MRYLTTCALMLALASCQMLQRNAEARPGEDWKCGRLPVFVYADKYGDENGENRPPPPFKMAFDHGKTGKRLPSHLFTQKLSATTGELKALYYRGKRCTWIDDPPPDSDGDTVVPSSKDLRQTRQPVIRALGR